MLSIPCVSWHVLKIHDHKLYMITIIYHVAANQCPVSLTCVASKILEHILTSQLMTFEKTHNLFHPNLHGFRKNHGCEKQLIELVSYNAHNLHVDLGEEIEARVLDFSKAFDKSTITISSC